MQNQNLKRCNWTEINDDIYNQYHDNEWGVPVYEDSKLFEMLILESFQAGLSWLIILKKREAFRATFENFNPVAIAEFNQDKIDELLNNEKIIRNKAKINASVVNAKKFIEIQKEYGSFSEYIWGFTNHKIIKNLNDDFHTKTELSDKISKDMKKRGMKFLGSVTVYSYLQAAGIVNDHETRCFRYNG